MSSTVSQRMLGRRCASESVIAMIDTKKQLIENNKDFFIMLNYSVIYSDPIRNPKELFILSNIDPHSDPDHPVLSTPTGTTNSHASPLTTHDSRSPSPRHRVKIPFSGIECASHRLHDRISPHFGLAMNHFTGTGPDTRDDPFVNAVPIPEECARVTEYVFFHFI